jgi:hypothetical protein
MGLTTPTAIFATNNTAPDSLGRTCPFGGRVTVQGFPVNGFSYVVEVSPDGSVWTPQSLRWVEGLRGWKQMGWQRNNWGGLRRKCALVKELEGGAFNKLATGAESSAANYPSDVQIGFRQCWPARRVGPGHSLATVAASSVATSSATLRAPSLAPPTAANAATAVRAKTPASSSAFLTASPAPHPSNPIL